MRSLLWIVGAGLALAATSVAVSCVSDVPQGGTASDGGGDAPSTDAEQADEASRTTLVLAPSQYAYTTVFPGDPPEGHGFVLTNNGAAPTPAIAPAAITGASAAFQVTDDGCKGQVLGPGASCTVTVALASSQVGEYAATLTVASTTAQLSGAASFYRAEAANLAQGLRSIWGGASVFAGGDGGFLAMRGADGTWARAQGIDVAFDVRAVCGETGYDTFAVGTKNGQMAVMYAPNGSNVWSYIALPGPVPATAVACASGPTSGLAQVTTVLAASGAFYTIQGHAAPNFVNQVTVGGDAGGAPLSALSRLGQGELCAAGEQGRVDTYSTGSGAWAESSAGSIALHGVWWGAAGSAYVVGDQGIVRLGSACNGLWADAVPDGGTHESLRAVAGASSNGEVYAVGDHGAILHYGSSNGWTTNVSGSDAELRAVWVSADGSDVYVAAADRILHKHL